MINALSEFSSGEHRNFEPMTIIIVVIVTVTRRSTRERINLDDYLGMVLLPLGTSV